MELKSLYFSLVYVFLFSSETRIYIYIYIYTRFQKGFHIERYIDRYILLFSCTSARVHFSLVIVQLVKNLGSTIKFLFVRFSVPTYQKKKKLRMHEYCLQFSWFAYSWKFKKNNCCRYRISGKTSKILIFTTTQMKWKKDMWICGKQQQYYSR